MTEVNTWHDLETRSPVPIKNGTHAYAEKAEVTLWAYAGDEGEPRVWDLINRTDNYVDDLSGEWVEESVESSAMPVALFALLRPAYGALAWAHNGGMFDFAVLDKLHPGFTELVPMERRRDTMVQAFAHSLPGALDKLGEILQLHDDNRKLTTGRRMIQLFCVPRKDGGYNGKDTHPIEWQQFIQYAARDITTMRAAHHKMPKWNYKTGKQVDMWHRSLRMNQRGMHVDLELAAKAIEAVDLAKARMAMRTQELTTNEVQAATQRDALLAFILGSHGVDLPDMRAATLERRMEDPELPAEVKELLGIRLRASMNSVSKYRTLLRAVNSDGRLRGCSQYRGAGRTGRTAHRLFQPGNLPRPAYDYPFIETGIAAIKAGVLDLVTDNEVEMAASAIRGCITAPPGRKLVVADLSNIEGRVAAWLAGEEWKLQAFRDYDTILPGVDKKGKPNRKGLDLYIKSYMGSFNVSSLSDNEHEAFLQRQIGKVCEIMFQFGGGVGAWITGAATYGIDLSAMTEAVYPTLPPDVVDEARAFLDWLYSKCEAAHQRRIEKGMDDAESRAKLDEALVKARFNLPEKVFITCDSLKRLWRAAHPATSPYWEELEDMILDAITSPGITFTARKIKVRRDGNWLRLGLPSGRALCYPNIHITKGGDIAYTGQNTYTRQWDEVKTYGGKIFENCVAEGTPVWTEFGWVPIQSITRSARVWDGVEWVSHGGCIYSGNMPTITAFNVRMTADHRVLTTKGWRSASSCEGHHRAGCGLPHSYAVLRQRRQEVVMGSEMPVRESSSHPSFRIEETGGAGDPIVVRLHAQSDDKQTEHEARHVGASSLLGVAFDERSVPAPVTSCMGQLRRAWYRGLCGMVRIVRLFLGRYGADLPKWLDTRTRKKRLRLLTEQLRLGNAQSTERKPPRQSKTGHSERTDDTGRSGPAIRSEVHNVTLAVRPWLVCEPSTRRVYDLTNCGPRQRFVVRGSDGLPLIVHNCVQAVANDQFEECKKHAEDAGYDVVLDCHDELVAEVDEDSELTAEYLGELMCSDLGWNAGLPLAAAGDEMLRYHKT